MTDFQFRYKGGNPGRTTRYGSIRNKVWNDI